MTCVRWAGELAVLVAVCSGTLLSNSTSTKCVAGGNGCTADKDGLIIPVWRPFDPSAGMVFLRGLVYFLALCYMFLGVAIVADKFMAAIEVITSKEKDIQIRDEKTGETVVVSVRIWNETVSNLTLMALGSSAPEILLSVIEIIGNGFTAGDLGPGTIVGSAAFNLFCIIAICVAVIPDGEIRRIEHLRVFICTSTFSVFAYIWLYLIISQISPGKVDLWEALLTFAFFPILVILAYVTDKNIFFMKFLSKKYTAERVTSSNGGREDVEMLEKNALNGDNKHVHVEIKSGVNDEKLSKEERDKEKYLAKLRELREKHPDLDSAKISQMAAFEILNEKQKSRAYYRVATTRRMVGSGNVLKRNLEKKAHEREVAHHLELELEDFNRVLFDPINYTVMENVGTFEVIVQRLGDEFDFYTYVDYRTVDGTALRDSDYKHVQGTLIFAPGESQHAITITIVDDDEFEEDEHFKVVLSNVRNSKEKDGGNDKNLDCRLSEKAHECIITVLDDDHQGVFTFEEDEVEAHENEGVALVKVARTTGARGQIHLPFETSPGSAVPRDDYEPVQGEIRFEDNENSQVIKVPVKDKEDYYRNQTFHIQLGNPRKVKGKGHDGTYTYDDDFPIDESKLTPEQKVAAQGRPRLGEKSRVVVKIVPSKEMKNAIDTLIEDTNMGHVLSTSSWKEQFVEAITISAGDDDSDDADAEEKSPSWSDYIMHFLTLFWKLIFAFVPPTDYFGGWACFVVSIVGIGLMTALIGDLASHFGCTVGLKDAVTAISLVALGTSVPDTFASKTAAVGDSNADASVGNVTGSNAVNVFLGIGVAWSMAAVYHAIKGTKEGFAVDPGTLGFSVTVFCILACICIGVLFLRRFYKPIGGELGGPKAWKYVTSAFFVSLWLIYVLLSALVSYCVFDPGF